MNKEIWKPITGYEGYYEVSNKKMNERFNCSSDIIATRKCQYKKGVI